MTMCGSQLGAGADIVAVDSTSYYPPEAQALPNVGYIRTLAAEPIIALDPSLVLLLEDAGPPPTLDQLAAAEIPMTVVPDDPTASGIAAKIEVIARAVDREGEGARMVARVEGEMARLAGALAGVAARPKVLFVLSATGGKLLAAGQNTAADGIIALAGAVNAVDGYDGYKTLSQEAAVAAAPDALLFMTRTLDELGGVAGLADRPELMLTPAARDGRILSLDGLLLLGFGPRTPQAVRELAGALHPGIDLS